MKYVYIMAFTMSLMACSTSATPPIASAAEKVSSEYPRDKHGEVMPYYANKDAQSVVDAALTLAAETHKDALIVMGANWCHDSRALATHFETPRFKAMIESHYVLEYIDVGQKNKNQDIARNFGVEGTKGTPTVFIVDGDGTVRNLETAPTWRNAASRDVDDIYDYFRSYAHGQNAGVAKVTP